MHQLRYLIVPLATLAAAISVAAAAEPSERSGPWDLMILKEKEQVIAATNLSREKCAEGLLLAAHEGHRVVCMRYLDGVKAENPESQRYNAMLYPVSSPAECAIVRRMRNLQTSCVYR